MAEYLLSSSTDSHNWSYKSDWNSLLQVESILGSSRRSVNQTGFYFCADDAMIDENVKLGTYQEAKKNCKDILTPRICDKRIKKRLTELRTVVLALSERGRINLGTRIVLFLAYK